MKPSGPNAFSFRRLLVIHLFSLIEKNLYRLYILFVWVLVEKSFRKKDLHLQGIDPFHLSYQICRHRFVHYIPLLLTTSMRGVVIAPLSFLILVISIFSLFLFTSLPEVYPFLLIFSNNWLLVLLIFSVAFLLSISFISILIAICFPVQET